MDDPPPPEYESPMTPLDGSGTELQEPYTSYTPYSNQPATRCIQGLICMVIVNTVKQQQTLSSYDQTGQYGYQSPCNMCTCVCGSSCCCPTSSPSSSCPSSPMTSTVVTARRGGLAVEEPKKRRPGRRPISELKAEDENSCITLSDKGNGYSTGEGTMCILVYRHKIRYAERSGILSLKPYQDVNKLSDYLGRQKFIKKPWP